MDGKDGGGGIDGTDAGTDAGGHADVERNGGQAKESVQAVRREEQPQGAVTCRGKYWRNQNRDSGHYTLVVEDDGTAAVLTLGWDRWDDEVLDLKETGRNLRFEGWWVCLLTRMRVNTHIP